MKAKYKKGRKIESVGDFEKSQATYFRVRFGENEKTLHRSFIESWQYHTLYVYIHYGGRIYEAEPCADGERRSDDAR